MAEIQTQVDGLMALVREKKKISVAEASKELKLPESTIQKWVDFLVEEHILGIEYKFTTPYIYVHSEEKLEEAQREQDLTLKDFKDVFEEHAKEKEMPESKIPKLWQEHLKFVVDGQKEFFLEECKRRGIENSDKLFDQYVEKMTNGS